LGLIFAMHIISSETVPINQYAIIYYSDCDILDVGCLLVPDTPTRP
jgi:hypothetical protein